MHRRISILTPVLDDWASFAMLLRDISRVFTGTDCSVSILAVDDGSSTAFDPASVFVPAGSCIDEIKILRLAVNLGHQRAIAVGLSHIAKRDDIDAVVVMDSDGEDRPEDISALLAASASRAGEVVLARRIARTETRVFRTGYILYKFLFRAFSGRSINFGNFSWLPMPAVRRLVYMPELWNNLAAAVMRSRLRYTTVPVRRGRRYAGTSKMNVPSLVVHGLSAMSVYTDIIFVRILLAATFVAALSVLGMVAVILIRFFTWFGVPGWASTMFGDLVIVLLQTLVMIVATSLMLLAGRSQRPIVPIVDALVYVTSETHVYSRGYRDAGNAVDELRPKEDQRVDG
jgi:hypothetical protein